MAKKDLFINYDIHKYIFIIVLFLLAYLSYLLIKPYLITIITAFIITLIFYPVYKLILKGVKKKTIASLLTILIIFLILIVPSIFITQKLANDTYDLYKSFQGSVDNDGIFSEGCEGILCDFIEPIENSLSVLKKEETLTNLGKVAKDYSLRYGKGVFFVIGDFVIKFFIFLLILYYLFIDGVNLVEYIKKVLPMDKSYQNELIEKAKNTLYAVLYGNFLTGIIQAILAVILYYILGVPSPLFFGLITFIGAITIGTWIAWGPVAIWMIIQGILTSTNSLVIKGIVLIVIGVAVISTLDNLVRPYLIKRMTDTNVVVILLGLLGGIKLFGLIGVFIGPVILALFLVSVRIYSEK